MRADCEVCVSCAEEGEPVKSRKRTPRGWILLVVVAVILAVVIGIELLGMRTMQEEPDASDVIQTLTEHDGMTTPETVDLQLPTESGETTPAAEGEPGSEKPAQNSTSAGNNTPRPAADSEAVPEVTEEIASGDITCDQFGMFSGQFVEDGRDELVQNVAAVLVTNRTDRFLDFATLSFDIDGQTALFILSGLPAGRSAWVMEATRMTVTNSSVFTYQNCVNSFRDDVTASTDKVTISSDGNMLTAVNNTSKTLEGVFVYYRTLHTDGNFLGGITYRTDFGTLEPGASAETMAGHFNKETTEIVRIGWQED